MSLVFQTVAVLVVATMLAAARSSERFTLGLSQQIVVVTVAVAGVVSVSSVWTVDKGLFTERRHNAALSTQQAAMTGGLQNGANAAFVEWVRRQLPPRASFYLVTPPLTQPAGDAGYKWTSFRLLPRLVTDRPGEADWLVFYDIAPAAAGYARGSLRDVRVFGPRFLIARRR